MWGRALDAAGPARVRHRLQLHRLPPQGRRRVAVNLRLTEPGPIANVPVRHFDGLDTWESRPPDGSCVKDLWYSRSTLTGCAIRDARIHAGPRY